VQQVVVKLYICSSSPVTVAMHYTVHHKIHLFKTNILVCTTSSTYLEPRLRLQEDGCICIYGVASFTRIDISCLVGGTVCTFLLVYIIQLYYNVQCKKHKILRYNLNMDSIKLTINISAYSGRATATMRMSENWRGRLHTQSNNILHKLIFSFYIPLY
jgi:hypothetical protein